jgi:hypothetical protein
MRSNTRAAAPRRTPAYELCKGQELPDYAVEGLEALVDKWPLEALERLVEEDARKRVCERAQMLLQRRVLEV